MHKNNPSALIISRSEEIRLNSTSANKTLKGGYILKEANGPLNGVLLATGSDVIASIKIAMALEKMNIYLRVVSMPSVEIFDKQSVEYRKQILTDKKVIAIESSNSLAFTKYTNYENIININKFGESGKEEDVLNYLDFDISKIMNRVINLINKH